MEEDRQGQGRPGRRPTVGEVRRRLAELGHPWKVDPRLRDEEEVPEYGRGGGLVEDLPGIEPAQEDFDERLRREPPSNPFLRARWAELGRLETGDPGQQPEPPVTRPERPERRSEGGG